MHVALASGLTRSFGRRDDVGMWYPNEDVFCAVIVAIRNLRATTVMLVV